MPQFAVSEAVADEEGETMKWLIAYSVLATLVMAWALIELKAERGLSRMAAEFRENDRKFYRGWEDIWFKQLEKMAESVPKKPPKVIIDRKLLKPLKKSK